MPPIGYVTPDQEHRGEGSAVRAAPQERARPNPETTHLLPSQETHPPPEGRPSIPVEKLPGVPVTIERDVGAAMRDGTILRADVYCPQGAIDLPVLLTRGPYDKRVNLSAVGNTHPAWYAQHGYVVVAHDTRGRYASDGDFYPFLHEMDDGYDSV